MQASGGTGSLLNILGAYPLAPASGRSKWPTELQNKDLCVAAPAAIGGTATLQGLCRTDSAGVPLYRINIIDDIDENPNPGGGPIIIDPYTDADSTIIIRAECRASDANQNDATGNYNWVATVEVSNPPTSSGSH